jgi:hypothetical protein
LPTHTRTHTQKCIHTHKHKLYSRMHSHTHARLSNTSSTYLYHLFTSPNHTGCSAQWSHGIRQVDADPSFDFGTGGISRYITCGNALVTLLLTLLLFHV